MPAVGTRKSARIGSGNINKDPNTALMTRFRDVAQNVLRESGFDLFGDPYRTTTTRSSREALKNFFIEESYDRNDRTLTDEDIQDHHEMMGELFENDVEAFTEYAPIGAFNPVIGMTFPLHKNLLMNNIFDKGAIPKVVAREPKFTLSMETRILRGPDGKEIDMFKEQKKMYDMIESTAPIKETILAVPELETTDVLATTFGGNRLDDNLSIESHISEVLVNSYCVSGDTYWDTATEENLIYAGAGEIKPVWFKIPKKSFVPAYGEFDRQLMDSFTVQIKEFDGTSVNIVPFKAMMSGYVNKNMFMIQVSDPAVSKVKLCTRIDTSSAMLRTCSVAWSVRTDIVEIPNAIPINVAVSPEEVKDIGALYQVNQLNKLMSLFKTTLGNYKDDKILINLNESFLTIPDTSKIARVFDFAPREGYALDHVEWRHRTFMDALDTHITFLLQVLNDPNMTITVIGRADLVRKITPTDYVYQTPSSIGPVELDFVKTITTSDKRTYQFIASDKLRDNNNLIIILCPRNTERIVYRIYDYQMYVSNEIRNATNYALPAIHAFERWKFVEYQPVQGRLRIINPTGYRDEILNNDPIGTTAMNDYTANSPYIKP